MLPRPSSIKLMTLFGIRIGVNRTWFLLLFVMIFWLSGSFRQALHSSDGVAYLTAVVTVLVLFGSLIIHELGHALVARRQGIDVQRIELFLFGGFTQMSRDAGSPAEDFKIAAAGPLATFAFVLLCLAVDLAIVGTHRLIHAALLDGTVKITPVLLAASWLLFWNVLLLGFNLVPAFPLDGGRMARAVVWRMTGSKSKGTAIAARLGLWFGLLLGAAGAWLLLDRRSFTGLWLMAIAWLLYQSARGALRQTSLIERIEGVTVSDVMDPQPVAIRADTPVGEALDDYFLRYGWGWFPVIDEHGHLLGIAQRERLQATFDGGEGWLTVGSVLDADEGGRWRIALDQPLTEALSSDAFGKIGAVLAVDRDGVLRGVLTSEQVRRALQSAFAPSA